jgi:ribosomal protein S18 acetylase RimI-like enzyme
LSEESKERVELTETHRKIVPAIDPFDLPEGEVVRFTMFRSLENLPPDPPLPFGYRLEVWNKPILPAYAAVLAVSFADSPDLDLYPRLASKDGCENLVKEMSSTSGFVAGASWIALFGKEPAAAVLCSRTVDGLTGFVNVVAVAPRHRRIGIGKQIVNKALWAFHDRHLSGAATRISRGNRGAIMFFRSIGFQVGESRTHL